MNLNPFSHKSEFEATTMVSITDDGKNALNQEMVKSLRQTALLDSLESSPRSLHDLSRTSHLSIFDVKNEVARMRKSHWVKILEE